MISEILCDFIIWMYLSNLVLSSIGFGAFWSWWRKKRSSTYMYKAITFLFFASVVSYAEELFVRVLRHTNVEFYYLFMSNWVWGLREVFIFLVYFAIVFEVLKRIIYNK